MNVKIDTKEKFCVITPELNEITANMSDELYKSLSFQLSKSVPHTILNLHLVEKIEDAVLTMIYEMISFTCAEKLLSMKVVFK